MVFYLVCDIKIMFFFVVHLVVKSIKPKHRQDLSPILDV